MKRSIWLYIFTVLLFTGLLSGCYPDKIDYMDEYDLAGTAYDKNADFGSYTTFTVVDTIVHITDDGKDDPNLSRDYDDQVLDLIRENMTGKGYTEIASPDSMNMPDLVLFVEAVSSDYFQYWGGYWGDYWGWYPGWDMWYPGYPGYYPWYPSYPWYPGYVTSYTTGTLLVEMFDATTFDPEDRTADVLWLGIVDGLLSGSSQNMAARLEKQINQLFIQSDYLEK